MFDLVIFDCDGVLIDSEILSCNALIDSLAESGIHVERDFVFKQCIGHSFPTVLEKLRGLSGRQPPESFEQAYRAALLRNFEKELRTVAGVEAMLAVLDLPYCIATSSSADRAQKSLAMVGLSEIGVPIFTAAMVKNGKPAPDLFLFAAKSMRVSPANCLVIEDSMPGILAAHAAGMTVWRFTGGSHFLAGFGQGEPTLADREFSDWDEFTALIRRPLSKSREAL